MRFVHTADWQLGMTRHFLEGEAQPRYSAARRDAVAGLGALAAEVGAEFVVVSGDVFEDNQLAPRVVSQSLEAMRAIGIPVYLLPGNHDPLDAASVYTSALFTAECPDNVTVLDRAGMHEVRPGVQIVAAPWRSKRPTTDLVADVLADLPADGATRILVAHGGVDVLDPDPDQAVADPAGRCRAPPWTRGAMHYVALGDKHSRTEVGDTGRVWYSGSPEVTNYDDVEADPGHVLIVDVDEADPGRPVSVQARHIGRWRFVTLRRRGRQQPRHRRSRPQPRPVARQGPHRGAAGADRHADRHRPRRAGRVPGQVRPAVRLRWASWERHTELAVVPADGEFADLGIGGFAAVGGRRTGGHGARPATARAAEDAQAALALLLRLTRPEAARHEAAPAGPDELPRNRPPRHRVSRSRSDRGVSGANEIGKSSMIEALDLLLEAKDRSTKKEVKQVKPTHADVGAEVTAEISTGPYRFVYRKRFHKNCETELTVLAPQREQLTGDEAHDRVRAILAETVDTELWQAQRVLQSTSTSAGRRCPDATPCRGRSTSPPAKRRHCPVVRTEPLLIDRIDAEYGRYFTATGRPTGEWAAAVDRLQSRRAEVAQCAADGRRGRRARPPARRAHRRARRADCPSMRCQPNVALAAQKAAEAVAAEPISSTPPACGRCRRGHQRRGRARLSGNGDACGSTPTSRTRRSPRPTDRVRGRRRRPRRPAARVVRRGGQPRRRRPREALRPREERVGCRSARGRRLVRP